MKIIACASSSLDGYISDAMGDCSWILPEDDDIWIRLARQYKAVIVGKRTFDAYYGEVYPLAGATTYVVTTDTKLTSDDPSIIYVSGGALEVMRELNANGRLGAALVGGGTTYGLFAAANLIDEAWVSVYPLILGQGTRLLGNYQGRLKLTLQQGYALPGGVVHNRYEVG